MARKPGKRRAVRRAAEHPQETRTGRGGSERERIVEALMALLADKPIEQIGLAEIASRADVTLSQLRGEFPSVFAILAEHVKGIDREVLSGGDADMAEEPARERLFDVLMRRLEALAPYKAALRSLMQSAARNPSLAVALNGLAVRSQQWMLTAADIKASGSRGMLRAQGLTLLFGSVLCAWLDDEDPGLAHTMAVLDRELSRGERWAGFLDDLCLVPEILCRGVNRRARRRRGRAADEETAAA